jgi:enoyl-CoA hydratase
MAIELRFEEEFAILTINRSQALNALSFELIRDIGDAIDAIDAVGKSRARALIVTGAGEKSFCAGADIKELLGRTLSDQRKGAELGQAVFGKLDRLAIPSVAMVNGFAFGGGCELALACTFRLASGNARFALPEIKLGLIPGYGGTQRLPRLVGSARAMELILTGRAVKADEALRIGLVNRVVESPLLPSAFEFAKEFSGYSLLALQFAREAVQRSFEANLEQGLKAETDLSTLAYRTADAVEGMTAFLEKRSPYFKDE